MPPAVADHRPRCLASTPADRRDDVDPSRIPPGQCRGVSTRLLLRGTRGSARSLAPASAIARRDGPGSRATTAGRRPSQRRAGAPRGAPGLLLRQEASVSPCAPSRRPLRAPLRHRRRPSHACSRRRSECVVELQADGFVGSRVHAARLPIARFAHIGQGAGIRTLSSGRAAGPLHGSRELDPRGDVELAKDVAQVRLDRLEAEEELGGDLGVRLAVDD
jgi:hypothetical protein